MAIKKHIQILKKGVVAWNEWRLNNIQIDPDLSNADLTWAALTTYYPVSGTVRTQIGALLFRANLSGANLKGVDMSFAHFGSANLSCADLSQSDMTGAKLIKADLTEANLSEAHLMNTDFTEAKLTNTDLSGARMIRTKLTNTDLSKVRGLDIIRHTGPSSISIDTLYKSSGRIPEAFLRGCGVPDDFIAFIPSHFGVQQAIQFYSCFISYSTKDEEFASRLYSRMRDEHLRVWFAPEDIKGGQKLYEQIERAIQLHDRLLLVLSEKSMQSEWVISEIRNARRIETEEKRRKLFPIRLVDFEKIRKWKCFDSEIGKDLAVEVREYFIPDFSNWKEHDAFEAAFQRLLRDLKAEELNQGRA
jgi:hypothetical protein